MTGRENGRETGREEEDRILELARALPDAIEPGSDLWAGIEARLDPLEEKRVATPNRFPLTAIAAGLIAVAVLTSFWAGTRVEPDHPPQLVSQPDDSAVDRLPDPLQNDPLTFDSGSNVFTTAANGAGFGQPRQELALRVADQVTRLPEPTRELVVKNLNAINAALDEIDTALREDRTADPRQRLLLSMYTEQLTLLGEMEVMLQQTNEGIRL